MKKNAVVWIVGALGVAILAVALYRRATDRASPETNPYAYDLSAFRTVPETLASYTESQRVPVNAAELRALAVGPADRIYVAVDHAVLIFGADGRPAGRIGLDAPPHCLYVARDGRLLVGMRRHVEVYSPQGVRQAAWAGLGEQAYLTAVTGSGDNVFVADAGNRLVWRFAWSGRLLGHIGTADSDETTGFIIPSPYFDLVTDPDDGLWVANPGRQRLEQYDAEGVLRTYWGKAAMTIDGFSGCCNPCHLAIGPDGRFYTSEKGLLRVKAYEPNGRLAAVVAAPEQFAEETAALDLAVDSKGRVLVLDPSAAAVRIFTSIRETEG